MARLNLRVTAGAREDGISGWQGQTLRVKVRARPEKGRANEAVIRLLAGRLKLPRARLTVVRGAASRAKTVEVDGLSDGELRARLAEAGR
jgi:uncharacterized protein YggU (UPF0235/DUF167 family)